MVKLILTTDPHGMVTHRDCTRSLRHSDVMEVDLRPDKDKPSRDEHPKPNHTIRADAVHLD